MVNLYVSIFHPQHAEICEWIRGKDAMWARNSTLQFKRDSDAMAFIVIFGENRDFVKQTNPT